MSTGYGTTGTQVDMGTHWLLRIVAALIDSIPWIVIGWVLWWVLVWNGKGAPLYGALAGMWWLVYIFLMPILYGLLYVVYCTIMESSASCGDSGQASYGLESADAQRQ